MRLIAVFLTLASISSLPAARTDRANRLTGSWKLVSYTDTPDNGMPYFPFGTAPIGQFIYTSDGHFSVQVVSSPTGSIPASLPKGFEDMTATYLGYFGTWTTDAAEGALTYHLAGASAPLYVRSDVSRRIRFDGNRLIVTGESMRSDGRLWRWERILVREPGKRRR